MTVVDSLYKYYTGQSASSKTAWSTWQPMGQIQLEPLVIRPTKLAVNLLVTASSFILPILKELKKSWFLSNLLLCIYKSHTCY
jgi:hypothetical protein